MTSSGDRFPLFDSSDNPPSNVYCVSSDTTHFTRTHGILENLTTLFLQTDSHSNERLPPNRDVKHQETVSGCLEDRRNRNTPASAPEGWSPSALLGKVDARGAALTDGNYVRGVFLSKGIS